MRFVARAFAVLLAAVLMLGAPTAASAAPASEGSIPPEVRAYVGGGGLLDRLEGIYGLNADGAGIAFDDTTTFGAISRVFHFTDERLAGDTNGKPTRMVNEWAVPVSLGETPLGVATLWINTDTELPELAEFDENPDAAVALATVPDAARLVRLAESGAWFSLETETLTPLVSGASGISSPTPVADAELLVPSPEPAPAGGEQGVVVAIVVVVVLLVVVVIALLLPMRRRAV